MFRMKKRKAFTMVELMMLLLVASLIIAACLPVITKKHFKLPSTVIHGTYLCYYKNGKLHETKWVGRAVQKKILDRDTNNCVFEPPAKAPYFQVSAIGGGGGGGDAGYTGGDPQTGVNVVQKFSPFDITEDDLTGRNISVNGFLSHRGKLRAFAKGLDSGAGGDVGYATASRDDHCLEEIYKLGDPYCAETTTVTKGGEACYVVDKSTGTETEGSGTETEGSGTETEGSTSTSMHNNNIFARIAAKITNFFKTTLAFKPGVITGAADSSACRVTHTASRATTCAEKGDKVWVEPTYYYVDCNPHDKEVKHPATYKYKTEPYCKGGYVTVCPGGTSVSDSASTPTGNNGACKSSWSDKVNCTTRTVKTNDVDKPAWTETVTEYDRCKMDVDGKWIDGPCKRMNYEDYTVYDAGSETSCVAGENQEVVCSSEEGEVCTLYKQDQIFDYCAKADITYDYTNYTASGGAAGKGARCYSEPILGNLGLTYNSSDSTLGTVPADGTSYTTNTHQGGYYCSPEATGGDGNASCLSGVDSNSCGSATNATYSKFQISKTATSNGDGVSSVYAKAYSAWKGGTGAKRECNSGTQYTDYTATSSSDKSYSTTTVQVDAPSDGTDGSDGVCAPASHPCGTTGYCSTDDDVFNGYTLSHDYPDSSVSALLKDSTGETMSASTDEISGYYRFKDSFDQNYLQSGETGSPGEFRTVIVRSLKDMDTTIRIGRGGTAAPLGSGNNGSDGSPTIFGTDSEHYIVKSAGGAGGKGRIIGDIDYHIAKYDHKAYLKEDACWNRSKYFAKDEDGNYTDTSDAARAAQEQYEETGITLDSYCSAFVNDNDYTYHKKLVGKVSDSDYPTPIGIVSTVMNFVFNSNDSSDAVKRFVKFGRGGRGGGVEHRCWAGRWEVWFEGWLLKDTAVYGSKEDAEAHGDAAAVSEKRFVTNQCRTDWSSIPGSTGVDGALLIKW